MNWITNNWAVFLTLAAMIVLAYALTQAFGFKRVKQWLIYACLEAEKEFGSKTGQIKLRYVYNVFISKYTFISRLVSFEYFSFLVDEALKTVRRLLEENQNIANYVEGKHGDIF